MMLESGFVFLLKLAIFLISLTASIKLSKLLKVYLQPACMIFFGEDNGKKTIKIGHLVVYLGWSLIMIYTFLK